LDDTRREDHAWMTRAILLAGRGEGFVEPNPMVGCVIVREGTIVGEGYHRRFGGDHAEVDAIKSLSDVSLANGATAYVTLEPCCHTGKTPPCTEALISSGIAKVVVAMADPFPKVDGGGIRQLRDAGIEVDVGACHDQATELNRPYLKRLFLRRPWVIAKWAMSLDGRIATVTGDSQWISGELSRAEVHRLRGRVDAIIIGAGTMSADNPTLTARPGGARVATRVVLAGSRLPEVGSNLLRTLGDAPLLLLTSSSNFAQLDLLARMGVEIIPCESADRGQSIRLLLDELGRREMTNVLVEGGGEVTASFAAIDELDEIHAYISPKIIAGRAAPGPLGGDGFLALAGTPEFRTTEVTRFDGDLRVVVRRVRLG